MIEIASLRKEYIVLPKSIVQKLCDLALSLTMPLLKSVDKRHKDQVYYKYSKPNIALENVSIDIPSNSVIGILGLNGSGKSTLLQILSGNLSKTSGSISCRPEDIQLIDETSIAIDNDLTVDEAISSSLAKYSRSMKEELHKKIISYFDLSDKCSLNVGALSLGTKSRLVFALSTISDKSIILIDEVLGAGDLFWQDRCYHWLKEMCVNGKTVLMTSHDTQLLQKFCSFALWIDNGRIRDFGEVTDVARNYEAFAYSLAFSGSYQPSKDVNTVILTSLDSENSLRVRSNNRLHISKVTLISPSGKLAIDTSLIKEHRYFTASFTQINLQVVCNISGNYWPTAIGTLWCENGWRVVTFQNKSFSIELSVADSFNISFNSINMPQLNENLYLTISLFSTREMLTSVDEMTREDFLHKFVVLMPESVHNISRDYDKLSPFCELSLKEAFLK